MKPGSSQRHTAEVVKMLQDAGWHPGRNVSEKLKLPDGFNIHPAASNILREFAYLIIGKVGPGINRARSTVHFDPMLATGEEDRFAEYTELLNRNLYPLGEVDNGYYFLSIDEQGYVFLVMDNCWFVDNTFDTAIDRLLLGKSLQLVDEQGHW